MYVSLYETYLKMQESYTFYYAPQMENYLDLETRFENLSRLKLMAGRAQYQKAPVRRRSWFGTRWTALS